MKTNDKNSDLKQWVIGTIILAFALVMTIWLGRANWGQ